MTVFEVAGFAALAGGSVVLTALSCIGVGLAAEKKFGWDATIVSLTAWFTLGAGLIAALTKLTLGEI